MKDMSPGEAVFLYLPLPYWTAFVLLLYKYDFSRLFHPFRDNGSTRNWWSVLNHLGLLEKAQTVRRPGIESEVLPCLVYLAVSLAVSLSWVPKLFPSLWYYLIVVQGISAMVLTAATMQYLGPPPRRPYVDVLRYPRLGSRIRHLGRIPADRRKSKPAMEGDSPDGDAAGDSKEVKEGAK